jgi:hypothetical protein
VQRHLQRENRKTDQVEQHAGSSEGSCGHNHWESVFDRFLPKKQQQDLHHQVDSSVRGLISQFLQMPEDSSTNHLHCGLGRQHPTMVVCVIGGK